MAWEDPDTLLLKKHSREEYCQRLLTSLILAATYPKWNTRSWPSEDGEGFLARLHARAFDVKLDAPLQFIDEFNLSGVEIDERGGAPDYVVITPTRLWIIELKTEASSHRPDQLPLYARLAARHFPGIEIALLYLTPKMQRESSDHLAVKQFKHLFWGEIADLIHATWAGSEHKEERLLCAALERQIGSLDLPPKVFRAEAQVIRASLTSAESVQETGKQRGIETAVDGLQDLMDLRIHVRDALSRHRKFEMVRPWIWNASSSGGRALTKLGQETGFELRLSRYPRSGRDTTGNLRARPNQALLPTRADKENQ